MKSWKDTYQKELSSENTLECKECGSVLEGDSPTIVMVCLECWTKIHDAYPDGWTCCECGDEFHDQMPASIDGGTVCKKCVNINKE